MRSLDQELILKKETESHGLVCVEGSFDGIDAGLHLECQGRINQKVKIWIIKL